jgi:hypothetical protein
VLVRDLKLLHRYADGDAEANTTPRTTR